MSTIQRAYKTELALNNQQLTACRKHAGAPRWAYNWGLSRKQESYRAIGKSPSAVDLHRDLNAFQPTVVPWMYKFSKSAPQETLRNLDRASAHFFRRAHRKTTGKNQVKLGYPTHKTRKRGLGSFQRTGTRVDFRDAIQLPRLGRLRLKERGYLPTAARIRSATVSEQAGHWHVSVLVEQGHAVSANSGPLVGVDLGLKTLATLSGGTEVPNPRHLKHCLKQHIRCQRAVSRKQQASHTRRMAVQVLGRLRRRVANQRANTLHHRTSRLAKTKPVVVIEDLNVSGMLKHHHLAQAIGNVRFGELRRQLTYKAAWYGCQVLVASRWEPTSKTCSHCGWADERLTLTDRTFGCQACGQVLDRELNAAINLATLAGSSSESQHACGEDGAGQGRAALVQLSLVKQEADACYPLG